MHYIFVIVPIIPHTYTPRVQKQWNHSWTDVTAQGVEMSHLGRLLVAHAWAPAQGTLLEVGKSPGKWIIFRETVDFPHLGFTPGYITYFIYTMLARLQCFADFVLLSRSYFAFQSQGIWCFVSFMKTFVLKPCALSDIQRLLFLSVGLLTCGNFCSHIFCFEMQSPA